MPPPPGRAAGRDDDGTGRVSTLIVPPTVWGPNRTADGPLNTSRPTIRVVIGKE